MDGHGGKEVAMYVQRHLKDMIVDSDSFKNKLYEASFKDTFL